MKPRSAGHLHVRAFGMFGLFKKREWVQEVLPEMQGSVGNLHVRVKLFPCRLDSKTGERTYAYDDFGVEFINELSDRQLSNFEQVCQTLAFGTSKTVSIKLRDLPSFEVELKGKISSSSRQFYSDLADALIEAFKTKGIKP